MILSVPTFETVKRIPLVETSKKHVVLFGGSFDPVHEGHLAIARAAQNQLEADEVWFIPARQAPLKDRVPTDAQKRVDMLKLALRNEPDFKINEVELKRPGTSYTIDTVRELQKDHPECTFTFLIGADQLMQFHKWKEADKLDRLVRFACANRDGNLPQTKYRVTPVKMEDVPVSSTDIRKGDRLNYLDPAVLDYCYANRLYCKDFVKARVTEHRWLHSLSVADLCEQFARSNGMDPDKAWLTGLFHDVCKSMPPDKMRPWMEVICPQNLDIHPAAWHGFVGSRVVHDVFGISDAQIRNAIYHHVRGTSDDPYAMAVFCADKLDPLRGYDSYETIELCRRDLKAGFRCVKERNRDYVDAHRRDATWTN